MASLDWSQCPAVESIPGKVSGAWVFTGTRTPVAIVFEVLEDGMTVDEVVEQFPVTREQVKAVLEFAAQDGDITSERLAYYTLDQLVAGITGENRHDETDWGQPVGVEVW